MTLSKSKAINQKSWFGGNNYPRLVRGFTLIELLLVIGILGVLSTVTVLVINPAEKLKEARDSQRLGDLRTLESLINLSVTFSALEGRVIDLDGSVAQNLCKGSADQTLFISVPSEQQFSPPTGWLVKQVISAELRNVNGNGWIPIDFTSVSQSQSSPLSALPADPINDTSHFYVYVCDSGKYELSGQVESAKYSAAAIGDGGDTDNFFEVGSDLTITPSLKPTLSINNEVSLSENGGTMTFTVTLSPTIDDAVTVTYATADGSATAGSDYVAISPPQTLTFNPLETSKTITVDITDDVVYEGNENFTVNLSGQSSNAIIGNAHGVGTITDNETPPLPTLSIGDSSAQENAGVITFTVTLSGQNESGLDVTVNYSTTGGTATEGTDYTSSSGIITFPFNNPTPQNISVPISDDTLDETDAENFTVNLTNQSSNATIGDGQGIGTINDNDLPPSVSIDNFTQAEGDSGTSNFNFPVNLSAASGLPVTVTYSTANDTATAPEDYTAVTDGTITIPAGITNNNIPILVNGDLDLEASETFFVNLTAATNATIDTGNNQGLGTISNDDAAPPPRIDSVSPLSNNRDVKDLTINLYGQYFQSNADVTFSGTGIQEKSTQVNFDGTQIDVVVDIDRNALSGARIITVANPSDGGNDTIGFAINPNQVDSGYLFGSEINLTYGTWTPPADNNGDGQPDWFVDDQTINSLNQLARISTRGTDDPLPMAEIRGFRNFGIPAGSTFNGICILLDNLSVSGTLTGNQNWQVGVSNSGWGGDFSQYNANYNNIWDIPTSDQQGIPKYLYNTVNVPLDNPPATCTTWGKTWNNTILENGTSLAVFISPNGGSSYLIEFRIDVVGVNVKYTPP